MISEHDFGTPMMKQYARIKANYPDALLFFRLGDFYELFMEDAEIGAEVLDITLTSRHKGQDGKIPMCGVPYHSVESYISRLVTAGHKVAICEQIADADENSPIVERDVVRIVTPSTILDENAVPRKEPNYLMVLAINPVKKKQTASVAFVDLGTSDFQLVSLQLDEPWRELEDTVTKFAPKECIISLNNYGDARFLSWLRRFPGLNIYPFSEWNRYHSHASETITDAYDLASVESLGLRDEPGLLEVAAVAIGYLNETQKGRITHLSFPKRYRSEEYLEMDRNTIFNLELFRTIRDGEVQGSLLWLLDKTKTAMGGRLLREWLVRPSRNQEIIMNRHNGVEYFLGHQESFQQVAQALEGVLDIERILGRLHVGAGNSRDLVGLKQSLQGAQVLATIFEGVEPKIFHYMVTTYTEKIKHIQKLIGEAIVDEPPLQMRDGHMIRDGYSAPLDELRVLKDTSQSFMQRFLDEQKRLTNIPNLKVGSNKVFGYYLEVSKSHLAKVPSSYIRKQTLVNAERFVTQELKEFEEKLVHAEEEIVALEYELVQQVIEQTLAVSKDLFLLSKQIALVDVLLSFSEISGKYRYVRPEITIGDNLELIGCRHPVIERLLEDDTFVPNDVYLDANNRQIILLTGPNMAGKSTYIRQVAVTTLLAHIGCFVPCEKAKVGIVDKLFTRIGASDNLSRGLSTFMVEMIEVANIIHHATNKSLIILDEVGRGTSTYDGVSIAQAVLEHLAEHSHQHPKTLFATHFHELIQLADKYPCIHNHQVVVELEGDDLRFLHRVLPGSTDKSYGIQVAKRAGIPQNVINRANEILKELENKQTEPVDLKGRVSSKKVSPKISQEEQRYLF